MNKKLQAVAALAVFSSLSVEAGEYAYPGAYVPVSVNADVIGYEESLGEPLAVSTAADYD